MIRLNVQLFTLLAAAFIFPSCGSGNPDTIVPLENSYRTVGVMLFNSSRQALVTITDPVPVKISATVDCSLGTDKADDGKTHFVNKVEINWGESDNWEDVTDVIVEAWRRYGTPGGGLPLAHI